MPVYKYIGKQRFIDIDLGISVEPGQTFTTPYYLPESWKDFILISTLLDDCTPHTEDITVDETKTIDTGKYNKLIFRLKNTESATVALKLGETNKTIKLDDICPVWVYEVSQSKASQVHTVTLIPISGTPIVSVYFGFTKSRYGLGT